jgi:hypothetical protein
MLDAWKRLRQGFRHEASLGVPASEPDTGGSAAAAVTLPPLPDFPFTEAEKEVAHLRKVVVALVLGYANGEARFTDAFLEGLPADTRLDVAREDGAVTLRVHR